MATILTLEKIRESVVPSEVIASLELGFVDYSEGRVTVPPAGHLYFDDPPGDCHIKYGFVRGGDHFVVKVATGFYRNPDLGLSSSNGLMLVFSQRTGAVEAILLDEGWLTDVRTAAAGAIAAKHLGPWKVTCIGIVGTGTQARLQLEWLRYVTDCRRAMVWGRNLSRAERYARDMAPLGFNVGVSDDLAQLCRACNLVVTTTPSKEPLVRAAWIQAGTHVTAIGTDGGGKQELEAEVLRKADVRVVDSLAQCREYGDSSHALRIGLVREDQLIELGRVIRDPALGRCSETQISVADLTGVAVQDIRIAELVLGHMAVP